MNRSGRVKNTERPLFTIDHDDLWPRTPENRYRIYAVKGPGEMEVIATAEDAGGIGQALVGLNEDEKSRNRRLYDRGRIGVLDTMPGGNPSPHGEWIVLPWDRGGKR